MRQSLYLQKVAISAAGWLYTKLHASLTERLKVVSTLFSRLEQSLTRCGEAPQEPDPTRTGAPQAANPEAEYESDG